VAALFKRHLFDYAAADIYSYLKGYLMLGHPNVRLHFTPTYSSWLNQVELWFSKIERDLLARGIFTSVADLARKIRRYIHRYNRAPEPIRWAYRNPAHRIGSTSASTVH
jgi:transposase